MGQRLSLDLRVRLLGAIDAGMSCRAAAARLSPLTLGGNCLLRSIAFHWRSRIEQRPKSGCSVLENPPIACSRKRSPRGLENRK